MLNVYELQGLARCAPRAGWFVLFCAGTLTALTAGCASDSGDDTGGSTSAGHSNGATTDVKGDGDSSGGDATNEAACGTATPKLLYSGGNVNALAIDAERIYFVEGLSDVKSIPKAGGAATAVGKAGITIWEPHMLQDNGSLYLTDGSDVIKLEIATGDSVVLASSQAQFANGIDPGLALDEENVYFADQVDDDDGTPLGTINRVPKAGGDVTILAEGQAAPGSLTRDDAHLYWVNNGTATRSLEALHNGGLGSIALSGGSAQALFSVSADGKGVSPFGDLVLSGSDLYFTSMNLDDFESSGLYKLPKAGGTPMPFSSYSAQSGFVLNGYLYIDNGDRIAKIELSTGSRTDLVCFESGYGSISMVHDDKTIYYEKMDPENAGDPAGSIHSIPME